MAFPTLSRLGVTNFNGTQPANTTAEFALFHKEYSVDLQKRFNEKNIFGRRVMQRNIKSGTGASFPLTGKTSARYFVPGVTADLTGEQGMKQAEKTINVDRLLLSDILVPNMDELMSDLELRGERSKQQADALARKSDIQLGQLLILCSRASAIVDNPADMAAAPTGGSVSVANMGTDKDVLVAAIQSAVQKLATNDVPIDPDDIQCVVPTAQYFLLLNADKVVNRDYGDGGLSAFRTGIVPTIAGCPIDWTNNFPRTLTTAEAGTLNTYSGDFTKSYGVVFHKAAAGTVNLLGMQFESEYMIAKQANLFVAKKAVGHGYLRPEASVELCIP